GSIGRLPVSRCWSAAWPYRPPGPGTGSRRPGPPPARLYPGDVAFDRSSQSPFPAFAGSIHPPQLLHSVGGGAPYGGGTAAEQVGGLGMGEAAQVVVGEGKSLPLGQGGDGAPH